MNSETVTVSREGQERHIPLSLLELPQGFSDRELKTAVAAVLDTTPADFDRHVVERHGSRILLTELTDGGDRLVAGFVVWAVTFLLVGTIQGVVQVMPDVRRWIFSTGGAGHLIDPLAHAHVNLVGGVVMMAMATAYYLLPRVLRRPLHSVRLARLSLWGMAGGVSCWYLSMVTLGYLEGSLMLAEGLGFHDAMARFQPWHTLGFVVPASIMGIGHWLFIANVYLTVFRRQSGRAGQAG
ncbi:MAG: cbb3-type cytochrome c oxidase subunit I [Nitrospirota bacterium]|nr:cbb3-type cytochrome c oxidase subunit I [Nitrospirota bacterium]